MKVPGLSPLQTAAISFIGPLDPAKVDKYNDTEWAKSFMPKVQPLEDWQSDEPIATLQTCRIHAGEHPFVNLYTLWSEENGQLTIFSTVSKIYDDWQNGVISHNLRKQPVPRFYLADILYLIYTESIPPLPTNEATALKECITEVVQKALKRLNLQVALTDDLRCERTAFTLWDQKNSGHPSVAGVSAIKITHDRKVQVVCEIRDVSDLESLGIDVHP